MFLRVNLTDVLPEALRENPLPPSAPSPYTPQHLLAWLATKPVNETYAWMSCDNCLFAQYATAQGHGEKGTGDHRSPYGYALIRFRESFCENIGRGFPRTFGAARERIIAAIPRVAGRNYSFVVLDEVEA